MKTPGVLLTSVFWHHFSCFSYTLDNQNMEADKMDLWKRRVRPALQITLFGLEGTKLLEVGLFIDLWKSKILGYPPPPTRDVRAKASAPLAFVEADDKARSWPDNSVIEMKAMKIDRGHQAMHMVLGSAVFVVVMYWPLTD